MKIKVEAYIDVDIKEMLRNMTIVDLMDHIRTDVENVLKDKYKEKVDSVIAEVQQ